MPVGILGVGAYVPPDVIDNQTIATWANTSPAWIQERTGIRERRYAASAEPTSSLAHAAVRDLLTDRPDALANLGAIIVATSTPDQPQPATAAILQHRLDRPGIAAFDLQAVCAGFVYAVVVGSALAEQPATGPNVLVVGADKYSAIMNRSDRRTVSLFGDGAGAVLLGPVPEGFGFQATRLIAHGQYHDLVEVIAGGTRRPLDSPARDAGEHLFRMQGSAVRDYVLTALPPAFDAVLADAGIGLHDVDRFVMHQANPRLLGVLAAKLGIPRERFTITGDVFGNTGCASVPITLRQSQRARPLARGERILFAAVGGGMTAAAAVLTWY